MAYNTKNMLTDSKNRPIPQYYDPIEDVFKPITDPSQVNIKQIPEVEIKNESGNPIPVSFQTPTPTVVTLQNAATAIGNGTVFTVGNHTTLTIEISGTATSSTVIFEGSGASNNFIPIQGVNLSDLSMDSQTTGKNEIWSFDLTGLNSFRARISSISGGGLSIAGKASL